MQLQSARGAKLQGEIEYPFEVRRKLLHLVGLIIPLGYFFFPSEAQAKAILLGCMIIAIIVDTVRLSEPRIRQLIHGLSGAIIRPGERSTLLGSTSLLIASTVTIFIFPKEIAVAALGFLIVGDTAAALIGRKFGRVKTFRRKTLEGSIAFVAASLLVGLIIPGLEKPAIIAGAVVAAVTEAAPIHIDDNFGIPILSGVAMSLVRVLW